MGAFITFGYWQVIGNTALLTDSQDYMALSNKKRRLKCVREEPDYYGGR